MGRPLYAERLIALVALLAPGSAFAKSVAVAQLLAQGGLDPKQAQNISSLISSELDFMGDFDEVVDVSKSPSNASCLANVSCLKGLSGGKDALVTGVATAAPGQIKLDLVFLDAGQIVRTKQFTLPSAPDRVADAMNGVVNEIVKGQSKQAQKAAEAAEVEFDFKRTGSTSEEDDFAFDDFDPAAELRKAQEAERRKAEEAARAKAEADARARAEAQAAAAAEEARRLEEQRRAQEAARQQAEAAARAKAEADARARAEADARARAEADARAKAEAAARAKAAANAQPASPAIMDPSQISFGDSRSQITVEEIDSLIQFASPGKVAVEYDQPTPPPPRPTRAPSGGLEDLDDEELPRAPKASSSKPTSSKPTSSTTTKKPPSNDDKPSVRLALRGGYSRYYSLDFVTYGAELTVPVGGSGLGFIAGFEAYSTHRQIPSELWEELGRIAEWNTIFPMNAGLVYRIGSGPVTPYLGGDVVGAQYYIDQQNKSYFSVGGRGRLGADIRLADHVYLNLNVGVGAWQGAAWPVIEPGLGSTGLLPQLSGGLNFAF